MLTDFYGVGGNVLEYQFLKGIIAEDEGIDESASHKGHISEREV